MKIILLLLPIVAVFVANAQPAPGVWDQMRDSSGLDAEGSVESVELSEIAVAVTLRNEKSNTSIQQKLSLCNENISSRDNSIKPSEEMRAATFQQQVGALREAQKSGDKVRLKYRGPWNPCLQSVQITKK